MFGLGMRPRGSAYLDLLQRYASHTICRIHLVVSAPSKCRVMDIHMSQHHYLTDHDHLEATATVTQEQRDGVE
jgi:hypothetical protein